VSLPATLRRALGVVEGSRRHEDLASELRSEIAKLERRQSVKAGRHDRRPAEAGERFAWKEGGASIELVVREKGPGTEGRWWCISCGEVLEHNLAKDLHCQGRGKRRADRRMTFETGDRRARHVLAWRNFQTGHVEVP
jgi:hypothetical protein